MILWSTPRFAEHTPPPGHPERPERAEVFDRVAAAFRESGGEVRTPMPAVHLDLARVHAEDYLADIAATAGRAVRLDPDTFTSPETETIARLAAGAAIEAATHAWRQGTPAVALVRPPGHHAEPDRAMGFCLYNNVAIAARAVRALGADRVAIVDIDVHHGNGTQAAFYTDPSVLYVSTHQFPYYPGTGAADERGHGAGLGFTVNVPLAAGATDADYAAVYDATVLPALETFAPDLILVSAGFDAHVRDPLGGMRLTTAGYVHLIERLQRAAETICGGRTAWITEGGYDLAALAECLEGLVATLR
jgi:acetoin utilization deacetylase AcuC-like enzyme